MGPVDLKAYNFYDGKWLSFEFESGIKVEGLNVTGIRNINGKLMLIKLANCTVSYHDEVLFHPSDGDFDMVVGKKIVSAYAGAADPNSFPNLYGASKTKTVQAPKSTSEAELEVLYQKVRKYRLGPEENRDYLKTLVNETESYEDEWLLTLELLELSSDDSLSASLLSRLNSIKTKKPEIAHLIDDGLSLI